MVEIKQNKDGKLSFVDEEPDKFLLNAVLLDSFENVKLYRIYRQDDVYCFHMVELAINNEGKQVVDIIKSFVKEEEAIKAFDDYKEEMNLEIEKYMEEQNGRRE